jgi:hypothetical protein
MSEIRSLVQACLLAACIAIIFVSFQTYLGADAEVAPPVVTPSKSAPITLKPAEGSDLTAAKGTMSPIYPTSKYTQTQLAQPAKKPAKAKLAVRAANKMPMQLAYVRAKN